MFRDLYELTKRALSRGLENPFEGQQLVAEKQDKARSYLQDAGISDERIEEVWRLFNDNYFLRYRSSEIAWHTEWLADSDTDSNSGLVDVRRRRTGDGVEAVLLTEQKNHTFAHATAALGELGMTIMDARIVPLDDARSIDTYVFMESDKRVDTDEGRINKIRRALTRILTLDDDKVAMVTRARTRQARMFKTPTRVVFGSSTPGDQTVLELITADQPGLLSKVGQVFIDQNININSAKIMTIGERAEDMFYLSDLSGCALTGKAQETLAQSLRKELD